MTLEEFEIMLNLRVQLIKQTLAAKSKEYATDGDKLYNFKRAAKVLGISPKKALWGMASKHLISVIDIVESDELVSHKLFNEKIGDLINYLILLEAILHEEVGIKHVTLPASNITIQHVPETLHDKLEKEKGDEQRYITIMRDERKKLADEAQQYAISQGYDKDQIRIDIQHACNKLLDDKEILELSNGEYGAIAYCLTNPLYALRYTTMPQIKKTYARDKSTSSRSGYWQEIIYIQIKDNDDEETDTDS